MMQQITLTSWQIVPSGRGALWKKPSASHRKEMSEEEISGEPTDSNFSKYILRSDCKKNMATMSAKKKLVLIVLLVIAYLVWGSIISLLPPFYPKEAEAKGAIPSQVCRTNQLTDSAFVQDDNSIPVWVCFWHCRPGSIFSFSSLWNLRWKNWCQDLV